MEYRVKIDIGGYELTTEQTFDQESEARWVAAAMEVTGRASWAEVIEVKDD